MKRIVCLGMWVGLAYGVAGEYSGWEPGDPVPEEIAPIRAPFEMPQLRRPAFKDVDYDIRDYGALECSWDAGERIQSTEAIRRAIEECSSNGGGRVLVPKGDWISGAVHLRSNVNLHLEEGATLHFSDNPEDYLPVVHVRWEGVECYNYSPLVYAPNCENIAITGRGTLNGHGDKWWPWKAKKNRDRIKASAEPFETRSWGLKGGVDSQRPVLLMPWKSENVLIEGITLVDPPFWTVQPVYCENIIIRGITIDSRRGHNGDGIDLDSCRNVLIEYNDLQTNDDAVCLKSGLNQEGIQIGIPCENIVVRHFVARNVLSGSGGIVIGSEMSGGVRNVYVHDALFEDCDRGIRLKSTRGRGGIVENVVIEDVTLSGIRRDAFNVNTAYKGSSDGPAPRFRNIHLNNIQASDVNCPINLGGLPDANLEEMTVTDSSFTDCTQEARIQHATQLAFENVTILRKNRNRPPLVLRKVTDSTFKGMDLNRDATIEDCSGVELNTRPVAKGPNILFILVDDMGWSDLGCYGGEIETPNIDALAEQGVRFTQYYNTAKCMPSRACLLTGVYAQQCGMSQQPLEMLHAVTLGEVLRPAGYRTLASGKHHGTENLFQRGFDHYYGLRDGACNFWNPGERRDGEPPPGNKGRIRYWCDDETTHAPYTPEDRNFYATDAFTDRALQWLDEAELKERPFFLYLAYNAPHYPLHAWPEDIEKYKGRYDGGYEAVRQARYQRMIQNGLLDPGRNPLPEWRERDWNRLSGVELEKEKRRMEIYAAMIDRVDQNIGRITAKLKEQGAFDNTLILFASDNGGCAETAEAKNRSERLEDFGTVASYEVVGKSWATVQNTPLRQWKNYSHEGGIRTPLIACWPARIKDVGGVIRHPAHLIDVMPTLVEMTGATYPQTVDGKSITPMQGVSLLAALQGEPLKRSAPLFWQWSNGGAIRKDDLKAVFWGPDEKRDWELYDLSKDLNETHDVAAERPRQLETLKSQWEKWFNGVFPE